MELTETKPGLLSFAVHKYLGNITVPFFGAVLLYVLGLHLWRSTEQLDRLVLMAVALCVVAIGLFYYLNRRGLNQLDGRVDDKVLSGLCQTVNSMVIFGYLACMMALSLVHHH
jgi:hypothetical protein